MYVLLEAPKASVLVFSGADISNSDIYVRLYQYKNKESLPLEKSMYEITSVRARLLRSSFLICPARSFLRQCTRNWFLSRKTLDSSKSISDWKLASFLTSSDLEHLDPSALLYLIVSCWKYSTGFCPKLWSRGLNRLRNFPRPHTSESQVCSKQERLCHSFPSAWKNNGKANCMDDKKLP